MTSSLLFVIVSNTVSVKWPQFGKFFHLETNFEICFEPGPRDVVICGIAQYTLLWGVMIGYTITTATSIM